MDNLQRILCIFRELTGKAFDRNNYENRLLLQKLAYMLSSRDSSFAYAFNWYIRGPYSPKLTKEFFGMEEGFESGGILSQADKENVETMRRTLQKVDSKASELAASLIYISKLRKLEGGKLAESLLNLKPWFEEKEVKEAIVRLKEYGFI